MYFVLFLLQYSINILFKSICNASASFLSVSHFFKSTIATEFIIILNIFLIT